MADDPAGAFRVGRGILRSGSHWVDRFLALVLFLVFAGAALPEFDAIDRSAVIRVGLAFSAIVPLLWRRTQPLTSFMLAFAVVAVDVVVLRDETLVPVQLVALYSIARYGSSFHSVVGLVSSGGLVLLAQLLAAESLGSAVVSTGLTLIPWLLGDRARLRAQRRLELYQHIDDLEFDRDRRAREAVTAERLRFARELHDVVSHSMAAVALHAGGARSSQLEMEPEVRKRFATIEQTARRELGEIRQLLHALRNDGDSADLGPPAHLRDVTELVERHSTDTFEIEVTYLGDPRVLSPNVELAGYRIIHEALFNASRHGDADRAMVTIDFSPTEVSIKVLDNGQVFKNSLNGLGLDGMRERANMLGGSLRAGATESGWQVLTTIPLRRD